MNNFFLPTGFTRELETFLTERSVVVAGALVTYALARHHERAPQYYLHPSPFGLQFWTTLVKCRWLVSDEVRSARNGANYGSLFLGERWVSGPEKMLHILGHLLCGTRPDAKYFDLLAMDFGLFTLGAGGVVTSDSLFLLDDPGYGFISMERFDGHGDEWPAWVFKATRMEPAHFGVGLGPSGPLVKPPLRPYDSYIDAVNDWFNAAEKPMIDESAIGIFNNFTVIIPDTRARIIQTRWQKDRVRVEIGSRNQNAHIKLQGIAHTRTGKIDLPTVDIAPQISFSVPDHTSYIEMLLVADNDLVSKTKVYKPRPPSKKPSEMGTLPHYVLNKQPWFTKLPDFRDEQAVAIRHDVETLIIVAVQVELEAVLRRLCPLESEDAVLRTHINTRTYYLGRLGAFNTVVTMSNAGALARDGSTLATRVSIDKWHPKAILMPGIAFGSDRKKQRIGDVLVASKVIIYEPQRVGTGEPIQRGPVVEPGQTLLDRFRNAILWKFLLPDKSESKMHFGFFLSGEKLIDNAEFKSSLLAKYPEAVGGDMEAAGVYAAAGKLDWIVTKGVCDWADGKKGDSHQQLAAAASVSLVEYVLSSPDALSGLGRGP
jgi:nucleoside phosphorylase